MTRTGTVVRPPHAASRADVGGGVQKAWQRAQAWMNSVLDPPDRDPGPVTRLCNASATFVRAHARATDAAIAAAVLAFGLLDVTAGDRSILVGLLMFALAVPLVWRRRAPILVFLLIAAVAFAQWSADLQLHADVALLVAAYTVAHQRPRRAAIGAAVILETGAVLAAARWSWNESAPETFALVSGLVVAALVSGIYFRARHAQVATLVERAARLEVERDQQARLATAAERARIAREMHDVIAHSLAVMTALADGATAKLRRDPEQAREAVESVSTLGRQALDDAGRLLSVLRSDDTAPARTPQPGIDQIPELVDHAASTRLTATLIVHGNPVPVPSGPALAAYRITQEAITNALKHAHRATTITVELTWTPHRLRIVVTDDGHSTIQPRTPTRGFGLAGMRERAALYYGTTSAGPTRHGGWSVEASIPIPEQAAL